MKFKLLTLILTKMLGIDEEANKADMHLPTWIAGFGLALILGGFICIAAFIASKQIGLLAIAVILWGISPFALLCYKNQRIYVISDEEFEYSTFTGKMTIYRFDDIKALRANNDSMTLFVGEGKVHIEGSAILSQRLMDLINAQLAKIHSK